MQYMLLLYDEEATDQAMSEEERAADLAAWAAYSDDLGKTGMVRGGAALQPITTATTVRGAKDGTIISDGPFAETKEQLGGYFVIDAADLDQAIAWAGKMPHIPRGGTVEIRPVMDYDASATR